MNECDLCGLEDPYCSCYEQDLEKRITKLEEELDKLTEVVKKMNNHLIKISDAAKEFKNAEI